MHIVSLILIAAVIVAEIIIDSAQIARGVTPHRPKDWIRIGVELGLLSLIPVMGWDFYLLKLVCNCLIFWFFFDYGLNIARGKPLMYLGDGFLDELQKESLGVVAWFYFKLIFTIPAVYYLWNPVEFFRFL
jgi:hypothetical protein